MECLGFFFFSLSLKSFTGSIVTLSRLSRIVARTSSHWLTGAGEFVSLWRRDSRTSSLPNATAFPVRNSDFQGKKKKGQAPEKSARRAAGGNVLFQLWRSVRKSFKSR